MAESSNDEAGHRAADAGAERYLSGDVIGDKYELIRCLGEGGMGSVWVARNLALDAQVAIKLIRSEIRATNAADRLLTEARAAAKLKHPAIVRVFDFGRTAQNDPFIVMELLAGENLGSLIHRQRRLPATYAVQLMLPIVDALHVAHAGGVVHRDLKPDNVFLASYDGRLLPKVVDFGVAKVEQEGLLENHKLTDTGTVVGSPEYMAPEQAAGEPHLDHRVDIWGLSMVLYESVTGRTAFVDPNYHALLRKIIERPARTILDYGAGDEALWAIIERGLRKDREQRWQSMLQLGKALAGWLIERGVAEDVSGHGLRTAWLDRRASLPDVPSEYSDGLIHSVMPSWRPPVDSREEGTVPGSISLVPPKISERPHESETASSNVTLGRPSEANDGALLRRRLVLGGAAIALVSASLVFGLGLDRTSPPPSASADPPAPRSAAAVEPAEPAVTPAPSAAPAPAVDAVPSAAPPQIATASALASSSSGPPQRKVKAAPPSAAPPPGAPAAAPAPAPPAPKKVYEDLGF